MSSGADEKKKEPEGKKFRDRVEEFKLWSDDKAFKELEDDRRREEKKRKKGVLKSDNVLQRCKKCYIPSIVCICAGGLLLLCSSIESFAEDSIFFQHQRAFQIAGGVIVASGVIQLMFVAVYTYHREDDVRLKHGLPSLYESSKVGNDGCVFVEKTYVIQSEFIDYKPNKESSCNGKLSRMTSYESSTSIGVLGNSFSSASTAMTWVHQHASRFKRSNPTTLRRLNSDTALDQSFARARLLAWREEAALEVDGREKHPEEKKPRPGVCPSYSISSTTSSGYHSLVVSPTSDTNDSAPTFLQQPSQTVLEIPGETETGDLSPPPDLHGLSLDSNDKQILKIVIEDIHSDERQEENIILPDIYKRIHSPVSKTFVVQAQTHCPPITTREPIYLSLQPDCQSHTETHTAQLDSGSHVPVH